MRPRVAGSMLLVLGACSGGQEPTAPAMPPLPPVALQPFLPALEALAAALPQPPEAEQREVRELAELALEVAADPRTQSRAERALREHGAAWFALEPLLLHDDVGRRRRAAWLCGQTGLGVLQLPLLLRLKYEMDPETVLWVADALQRLGNDSGLGWLDAAMAHEATAQQAGTMAIEICRERGITLAESPTWAELRGRLQELMAAWRLRGISSRPGATAPPQDHLDPRFAAHLATTQGTQLRPVDDARFVLTKSGRLPVPLLVRTLTASEPYLRTMALQVLTELGPVARSASPAVLPLLGDPLTASYAVRALGEVGAIDALPHLRARLQHPDTEQRAAAAQAVGLLNDQESAAVLTARLQDAAEAADVRVGAAFGLLCLGANPAAEAFLADREQKGDYHAPTLRALRDRLARVTR